jgi:Mn2+/Fe2+ NRAMP family transporter
VPLVSILFLTQALNAVLLLPLLVAAVGIVRDPDVMGEHAAGRWNVAAQLAVIRLVTACTVALAVAWLV